MKIAATPARRRTGGFGAAVVLLLCWASSSSSSFPVAAFAAAAADSAAAYSAPASTTSRAIVRILLERSRRLEEANRSDSTCGADTEALYNGSAEDAIQSDVAELESSVRGSFGVDGCAEPDRDNVVSCVLDYSTIPAFDDLRDTCERGERLASVALLEAGVARRKRSVSSVFFFFESQLVLAPTFQNYARLQPAG